METYDVDEIESGSLIIIPYFIILLVTIIIRYTYDVFIVFNVSRVLCFFIARKKRQNNTYIHIESERGASVRARWRSGANARCLVSGTCAHVLFNGR